MDKWIKAPKWVIDPSLSPTTLKVGVFIMQRINIEYIYYKRSWIANTPTKFANALQMGKPTIIKAIKELVRRGYIIRTDYPELSELRINWATEWVDNS